MAARSASLLLILLLAALAPGAHAQGVAPALVSLDAGYGSEAWKDDAAVPAQGLPGLPLPGPAGGVLGVYENPYANPAQPHQGSAAWLGYNLTATIELRDASGAPLATAGDYIRAELQTDAGPIPAKLTRLTASRFAAQFDLDGENGADFPVAPAGPASLVVRVYEGSPDPTVAPAQLGSAEFPLTVFSATLDRGGLALPESDLPGYADVGPGNTTYVQADMAAPGKPISIVAQLGAPGVPALLRSCVQATCTELFRGTTDASGRIGTSLDPARFAGNQSGLVLVAASLDASKGQAASAAVAIPVGTHVTRITSATYTSRAVAGQPLDAADTLVIGVEDAATSGDRAVQGTMHVLDAGGKELTSQPFDAASFLQGTKRTVTIPASGLAHSGAYYRLVGFLTTQDNRVVSLHQALRGLGVGGSAQPTEPFRSGTLQVGVRSFQNNLDSDQDAGLALPVHVVVAGLPGHAAVEVDVSVDEGGEKRIDMPFSGDAGTYPVTINVTSGELHAESRVEVVVARLQNGILGLPAPEPVLVLALVGAAALLHRRQDA